MADHKRSASLWVIGDANPGSATNVSNPSVIGSQPAPGPQPGPQPGPERSIYLPAIVR